MKQPQQIVDVQWVDAASSDFNWTPESELECCTQLCRSVGWILKNTNDTLSLVQNVSHDDYDEHCYSHVINIPKVNITEVLILEPNITVTFDLSTPPLPA